MGHLNLAVIFRAVLQGQWDENTTDSLKHEVAVQVADPFRLRRVLRSHFKVDTSGSKSLEDTIRLTVIAGSDFMARRVDGKMARLVIKPAVSRTTPEFSILPKQPPSARRHLPSTMKLEMAN